MRTLKDFNLEDKKVLLRCDFNVPLSENGLILDDFRIRKTVPTIEYLLGKKAKVILMSHSGNPEGKVVEELRLNKVQKKLKEYLNIPVAKTRDCIGEETKKKIAGMKKGEVVLLENLRFYQGEEENNENFARELSGLGEIYVNDAFGACHRSHASIVGITKYLPSAAGLLLEKEIKILSQTLENPWRPLVVIIGGVKIATKIKLIEKFSDFADHLLLGTKMAEAILTANGILLNRQLLEEPLLEQIKRIRLTNPKIHLPTDGVMALPSLREDYLRTAAIGTLRKEEEIFDIGPETVKIFSEIIKTAKMIIWNGPVGFTEKKPFDQGTEKLAEAICRNHAAFKIAGGGETNSFLYNSGLRERFDHVSTGGGAMLTFLSGESLPGIEVLKNNGNQKR